MGSKYNEETECEGAVERWEVEEEEEEETEDNDKKIRPETYKK